MIGRTVSHYRITRKLGAGGMGVVYEAVDTNLDRTVALKFLPPEYTTDPQAKARFVHEAKAASALDHVNVCTVYEIGETDDGQMFLAMACYQGETLKERIARGPLPLDEAMDITRQVADGLAKAHEREIVHRDIKPANLFLTSDGLVKILDFGLAKLEGQTKITRTGTTLGTASYMSPEQARGEETDHRSDLWCLGVVLYEMVTGRVPFPGENGQAVIHGIMTADPLPVTAVRTGIPLELERIIGKCLAKDPRERYQHADELLADLRHLKRHSDQGTAETVALYPTTRSRSRRWPWLLGSLGALAVAALLANQLLLKNDRDSEPEKLLLAVLPFENLGDPADAYFADGIADEILTRLCSVPELGVIAKESAFQFRGSDYTIPEIGERLGVDYVLSGTIRWQRLSETRSRVRITPKLVSVDGNRNVWAEAYEEDLDQIFAVQADIGQRVIEALNITLLDERKDAIWEQGTENLEAYGYFLRARELNTNLLKEKEHLLKAEDLLEKAIELDPEFALAHAWLSMTHARIYHWAYDRTEARIHKAKASLDAATRLDADLPEVYIAAGAYAYWTARDYDKALAALQKARELRPNDWYILLLIGANKKRQGLFEEAVDYYRQALVLNPTYAGVMIELGICYDWLHQFEDAERIYRHILSLWPDHTRARAYLAGLLLGQDGDSHRAREILVTTPIADPDDGAIAAVWFKIRKLDGEYEEALADLGGPDSEYHRLLTGLRKAELYHYLKRPEDRNTAANTVRITLEQNVQREPEDCFWHRQLGKAYAYLGRKEDAIREGRTAVSVMPVQMDSIEGAVNIESLAMVYVLVGEDDLAIDQLEYLLSSSYTITRQLLRNDPAWAPLRDHPRFRELVR